MPLVPSHDPGNHGGKVHSHRFPAANTAVPFANQDEAQMDATEQFLKSGFITVDIFAVSPVDENAKQTRWCGALSDGPQAMSGIAGGRRGGAERGPAVIREVGKLAAPIDQRRREL